MLFWKAAKSWSAAKYGRTAELNASQGVTSEKSYCIVTTVTVQSGTDSETQTIDGMSGDFKEAIYSLKVCWTYWRNYGVTV